MSAIPSIKSESKSTLPGDVDAKPPSPPSAKDAYSPEPSDKEQSQKDSSTASSQQVVEEIMGAESTNVSFAQPSKQYIDDVDGCISSKETADDNASVIDNTEKDSSLKTTFLEDSKPFAYSQFCP